MEVAARLRYVAISPQKARLVADMIRGKRVGDAISMLSFSPKKAAHIIKKVLESALANAEHNHGADVDELTVKTIMVDGAPTYTRGLPRARGRSDRIIKRNSHISITVADGEG